MNKTSQIIATDNQTKKKAAANGQGEIDIEDLLSQMRA